MDELEQFKREINLAVVAVEYGYALDRRESSRASLVMRRETDGDKIVVATALDGHGVYFSVRDEQDHGSVIDFIMQRDNVKLGAARQILRSWLPGSSLFPTARRPSTIRKPAPIPRDQAGIIVRWQRMESYRRGYLEERGILPATVAAFADHVRIDARGNVAFRHNDQSGITGWELKNKGFTGFSAGGKKALFGCRIGTEPPAPHPRLVIAESAIDAMSFYQFDPTPGLFLSFAGALSLDQRALMTDVLARYPAAEIFTATDTDPNGETFAELIQSLRPDARRARSPKGKDWNDALRLALTLH
jgi:hypothetical protein